MSRAEYWWEQIRGWEESNSTQKNYCIEHRLSYSQFIYWRNRIKKSKAVDLSPKENHDGGVTSPQWIPVTIDPAQPSGHALALRVNNLQLEFSQQTDPIWLRQVVHELSKVSHS